MKRALASLVASAMLLFALAGCSNGNNPAENPAASPTSPPASSTQAAEPVTISVGVPTAPPALPVLHMMEAGLLGENVTIDLNVWNSPEELLAMVQGGEHDLYAFPLTVVSTLYNKGLDVRLMNVNTWGVTYFMTTDPAFETWADLAGKTVYIPLQSSPPDALTQYFLNEAGLTVGEDVEIVYASTAEVAALLASGEAEYATLIEPQVTSAMSQNSEVRRALSFEEEWQRVTGTDTMIPNAGFGTTQGFIDENPELTEQFQAAYAESVQWVLDPPAEAAALAEEHLGMKAAVVEAAIPNMGLTFKSAQDAWGELDTFYNLLNDFDPSMIGGKLPNDGLYYAGSGGPLAPPRPGRGPAAGCLAAGLALFLPSGAPSRSTGRGHAGVADPGAGLLAHRRYHPAAPGARPWDRDCGGFHSGSAVRPVPQTGGCGGAVHPCAPVGAAGMLGCAGSGMVWV